MKNNKKEVGFGALLLGAVSVICLKGMRTIDKKMKEQKKKS